MVKQTQTIRWLLPTNCSSVFDHFPGLALKGFNVTLENIIFEKVTHSHDIAQGNKKVDEIRWYGIKKFE